MIQYTGADYKYREFIPSTIVYHICGASGQYNIATKLYRLIDQCCAGNSTFFIAGVHGIIIWKMMLSIYGHKPKRLFTKLTGV